MNIQKTLLSPRELGRAIGVSESSIKRWADEGALSAVRTAGGHRRFPVEEALRYIRATGQRIKRPELLGLAEALPFVAGTTPSGSEADRLFGFLRAGGSSEARGLLASLFMDGWSVASIIDGPVREAMDRIGQLWHHEPTAIFWEHRATVIAIEALSQLRALMPQPPPDAPVALGGAPSGDPYVIPSLAASVVLTNLGMRVTNLGAQTPIETIAHAADELSPRLVWVSITSGADTRALGPEIAALAVRLRSRGCALALGGRCAESLGFDGSGLIYRGRSMAELEAFARGLVHADTSKQENAK